MPGTVYRDRREAGQRLAALLLGHRNRQPVVLGLARGGVAVGVEVASVLGCPLESVFVRKIGVPGHEELAAGAVVDVPTPQMVRNDEVCDILHVSEAYLRAEAERQLVEIARRRHAYVGARPAVDVDGRTAIVVDDGIATGTSMRAALLAVRRTGPVALIMVVPAGPPDTLAVLAREVDEVVCPLRPEAFYAIGMFYHDFHQVDDDEVVACLEEARGERTART
ncbi:MAG TPA: phosphoribosyltransferase family protein [Azospirillum sp.]|nr:phosphoribosyltransferase family protein [Azospirillum sp.]